MRRLFNRLCRIFTRKPKLDPDDASERVEVPPGWLDPNPNVRTACRFYYRRRFADSEAVRNEIDRRIRVHTSLLVGEDAKRFNRYLKQITEELNAPKGSGNAVRQDFDKLWEDGDRLLDDGMDLLDDGLTWLGEKIGTRKKRSPRSDPES